MSIFDKTLNEFLDVAASKNPTPGGGSVSAVVAANAAAMVCMVANLTLGKKVYEKFQSDTEGILAEAKGIMDNLKILAEKDMAVYQAFRDAWQLPSVTDEEKSIKKETIDKALIQATLVPLEISRECIQIMELALKLAPFGNKNAISDVGVGIYLAESALKSAMLSVDINLQSLQEDGFKINVASEKAKLLEKTEELKIFALSEVKKRIYSKGI